MSPGPTSRRFTRAWRSSLTLTVMSSSESDIYGAGDLGDVEHSLGDGQWKRQTSDTGARLTGVWGSGPTDIYVAADSNFVMHSTGDGAWKHDNFTAGTTFNGVWGSGPNDVYAFKGGYHHATGASMWSIKPTAVGLNEPI